MSQILIIDDDPTTRFLLTKALTGEGYRVELATNGENGLRKAQEIRPSLIICDWIMPIMDGLEVCRQVKKIPHLANAYFILLTSRDGVESIVEGLENGADDFLPKPIRKDEIKARVRAGLRLHQANRDLEFQKLRLESELAQASDYVRSLLPQQLSGVVNIQSYFQPSKVLGGDSFDFYWLDEDHLVIYLLDVSGHGVGAALLSVSVLNLLRTKGLQSLELEKTVDLTKPSQVLMTLNEYFQMSKNNDLYFTIWYGVYHRLTKKLVFSSAGHPPAILMGQKTQTLKTGGLPVGIMPKVIYRDGEVEVNAPSQLYVFSDGVYEITKTDQTTRTFAEFATTLEELSQPVTLAEIVNQTTAIAKCGDRFEDDFSLLQVNLP